MFGSFWESSLCKYTWLCIRTAACKINLNDLWKTNKMIFLLWLASLWFSSARKRGWSPPEATGGEVEYTHLCFCVLLFICELWGVTHTHTHSRAASTLAAHTRSEPVCWLGGGRDDQCALTLCVKCSCICVINRTYSSFPVSSSAQVSACSWLYIMS